SEQRMGCERFRFEFGMELAPEEPGMFVAQKLHDLDELAVGGDAAKNQTAFRQRFAIGRIEFVTMAMAFADLAFTSVHFARERAFSQTTHPRAEAHRPAHLFDVHQIAQLKDDRVRRLDVEFGRVGFFQVACVARKLDARGLHPKANSKVRRARSAGLRDRANHAWAPPLPKPARPKIRKKPPRPLWEFRSLNYPSD